MSKKFEQNKSSKFVVLSKLLGTLNQPQSLLIVNCKSGVCHCLLLSHLLLFSKITCYSSQHPVIGFILVCLADTEWIKNKIKQNKNINIKNKIKLIIFQQCGLKWGIVLKLHKQISADFLCFSSKVKQILYQVIVIWERKCFPINVDPHLASLLWKTTFSFFISFPLLPHYTDFSDKTKTYPKSHLNCLKATLSTTPFSYIHFI